MLLATTQLAKTISAHMQAAGEAYRSGVAKGFDGDRLSRHMQDELSDYSKPAWQKGLGFANGVTFDEPAGKLQSALESAKQKFWPFKYVGIGPFTNIGINMTKAGLKLTPLDLVRMAYKGTDHYFQMSGEKYSRKDFVSDAARQLLAMGVSAAMWNAVGGTSPWITGSADSYKEKGKREEQYRTAPPMSIRLGGKWYSYERIEPFATALGTMVNGIDSPRCCQRWATKTPVGRFMQREVDMVRDKTFLKSIGDVIAAVEQPEERWEKFATNFVTSWVPNTIKQPLRAIRGDVGENRALGESSTPHRFGRDLIRGAAPGVDEPAPKVDLWGEDVNRGGGPVPGTDFLARLISPVQAMPTDARYGDRLIAAWNTSHPNEEYHPETPSPTIRVTRQEYQDGRGNVSPVPASHRADRRRHPQRAARTRAAERGESRRRRFEGGEDDVREHPHQRAGRHRRSHGTQGRGRRRRLQARHRAATRRRRASRAVREPKLRGKPDAERCSAFFPSIYIGVFEGDFFRKAGERYVDTTSSQREGREMPGKIITSQILVPLGSAVRRHCYSKRLFLGSEQPGRAESAGR